MIAKPWMERYQTSFSLVGPSKFAKSVREKTIENWSEDKSTGILTFQSKLSETELKRLLGLPSKDVLVKAIDIKTEEKSVNMDENQRIKIDVPILAKTDNYESLKIFAYDLRTYKEITGWQDKEIIFATLSKSKMTHLRMSMSTEEQNNLEKFIGFLMKNFGISENRVWTELREFRQKSDESPLALWYRLINLYFQARGISVPESIQDSSQQKEITNLYQNALRDEELKRIVFTKTIEFNDLPIEVAKIASALTDLKGVSRSLNVMSIDSRGRLFVYDKLTLILNFHYSDSASWIHQKI